MTLDNGFTHFIVTDDRQDELVRVYNNPVTTHTVGSARKRGDRVKVKTQTFTTGGDVSVQRHPRFSNTITCFKGRPPAAALVGGAQAYDAKLIFTGLRKKYDLQD